VRRPLLWVGATALATAVGCGIGIGRDLRDVPTQTVVYDDVCKVQDYYDALATKQLNPPAVVSSSEIERTSSTQPAGGITSFAFEEPGQLQALRKVLQENWKGLPDKLLQAPRVEVQVKWAEKAGLRRVVTTEDAQINYDGTTSYLPYHVCLSELLFGAPLYRTRREMLGLPPVQVAAAPVDAGLTVPRLHEYGDAGVDGAHTPDAQQRH
jgi:hypothetical protein